MQPPLPCLCHASGVNGAGKTTQLQIIMGKLSPDSGEVVKAKKNLRIAYLAQVRTAGGLKGQGQVWLWQVAGCRTVRSWFRLSKARASQGPFHQFWIE